MSDMVHHNRYATRPTDYSWSGWWRVIKRAGQRAMDPAVSLQCAGAAFFGFLSLFPLLSAAVLLYGIFATPDLLQSQLAFIRTVAPADVTSILAERLSALTAQPVEGLGLGVLIALGLALWSGSRGVNAMMHILDDAYRETNQRSFIKNAALSVGMTVGALLFLALAVTSIAIVPLVLAVFDFGQNAETLAAWLRWPIVGALIVVMFALVMRQAPDRAPPKLQWVWPGAVIAMLLWLGLSLGFSFYVENYGSYGATFGALSTAVVLMLWLYYSAMVLSFSAMLNAEAEFMTRSDSTSGPSKPMGKRGAYVADHTPEKREP